MGIFFIKPGVLCNYILDYEFNKSKIFHRHAKVKVQKVLGKKMSVNGCLR